MTNFTAQYDNYTFDFDHVEHNREGSDYALDFMLNGKPLYHMSAIHPEYKEALQQLKQLGCLAPIVIAN